MPACGQAQADAVLPDAAAALRAVLATSEPGSTGSVMRKNPTNDDVLSTREAAERLGIRLIQPHELPPAAPVRPYLSEAQQTSCPECRSGQSIDETNLRQRIRSAVAARLGNQVDPVLLDTIITRVLNNIGMK